VGSAADEELCAGFDETIGEGALRLIDLYCVFGAPVGDDDDGGGSSGSFDGLNEFVSDGVFAGECGEWMVVDGECEGGGGTGERTEFGRVQPRDGIVEGSGAEVASVIVYEGNGVDAGGGEEIGSARMGAEMEGLLA